MVKRILSSPLFYTGLIASAVITANIATLIVPALISTTIMGVINGFGLAAVGYNVYNFDAFLYESSLSVLVALNALYPEDYPWWNEINNNVYLGSIPLENYGHTDRMIDELGIGAVLSVVQDFELYAHSLFTEPVTPENWAERNVAQLRLNTTDFLPPSLETLKQGVDFMTEHVMQGEKVYVHCKAGHGRSVITVVCYLMESENMTPDQAIQYVNERRIHNSLSNHTLINRIHEYHSAYVATAS